MAPNDDATLRTSLEAELHDLKHRVGSTSVANRTALAATFTWEFDQWIRKSAQSYGQRSGLSEMLEEWELVAAMYAKKPDQLLLNIATMMDRAANLITAPAAHTRASARSTLQAPQLPSAPAPALARTTASPAHVDRKKVFVIHGQDNAIRDSLFAFLKAIGLEPLDWTEAKSLTKNPDPHFGQTLNAALAYAQAILIALTPDDEARLRAKFPNSDGAPIVRNLMPQPQPTVLIEAGMALGRAPDRTVLVEIGMLRPFTVALAGYVVRLDNSVESRQELAERLEMAGCSVKTKNYSDWRRVGDFESPVAVESTPLGATPTPLTFPELAEPGAKVFRMVVQSGSRGCTALEVAKKLNVPQERAQQCMDDLCAAKYVYPLHVVMGPTYYLLDTHGRAYLAERGLL